MYFFTVVAFFPLPFSIIPTTINNKRSISLQVIYHDDDPQMIDNIIFIEKKRLMVIIEAQNTSIFFLLSLLIRVVRTYILLTMSNFMAIYESIYFSLIQAHVLLTNLILSVMCILSTIKRKINYKCVL
jgi:hypothetical protein